MGEIERDNTRMKSPADMNQQGVRKASVGNVLSNTYEHDKAQNLIQTIAGLRKLAGIAAAVRARMADKCSQTVSGNSADGDLDQPVEQAT